MSIQTPITKLLGIRHPVLLAGMGLTSGAPLVAAVSNAGGLGVIGGVGYTPQMLREMIAELKANLDDPSTPFGVDLLIPQVGGSARKTNYDYTKGTLNELIDIIIESGAKLFVSAVGVPPKDIVEKLHRNGVLYMNMVGHPKHAKKACEVGADLICAQGAEAGGHTGEIPTSILIPACADVCKQYTSSLTKQPVQLVAAGGIYDGRGLAAALMLGASAVWVGTRFVTAKESGASEQAKQAIAKAGFDSTIRTIIFTGRPVRALSSPYIENWERERRDEIESLTKQGILPVEHDLEKLSEQGKLTEEIEEQSAMRPAGIVSGLVTKANQPAKEIVEEIVAGALKLLSSANGFVDKAKL
ncbi:2-nitropropane dioxygenase [Xylogone sp. PMI_703]|nr:2-nitropropane dioxygenase [Xylogone sp. PMI_703]